MVGELLTNVSEMDIFKLAEPLGPQVTIAIALAGVLYWRAWVHERRASESELRFISNLLINRSFTNLGKLVAHSVPKIFDRVFHPNVIWQFVWRSVVASTISWAILLTIRNPPLWKTHLLINWIITRYTLAATIKFVFADLMISYLLPCVLYLMLSFTPISPIYGA
jgi:hypothetical protein